MNKWMTVKEAAEKWFLSPNTICQYIRRGRIPAHKEGLRYYIPANAKRPPYKRLYKIDMTPEMLREREEKSKAVNRRIWNARKAEGKCVRCGIRWAEPGHVHCDICLRKRREAERRRAEAMRKRYNERRAKLKAEGKCVICAKPAVPGKTLCSACAKKEAERGRVRTVKKRLDRQIAAERARLMGGVNQ